MPVIRLETFINAPKETVFDLARSIDLHQISTAHTNEKAIAGKTSGLIELDEWVTWEARHFGIVQKLTSKITAMNVPDHFVDEMVSGAFKSFRHEHIFEMEGAGTLMIDVFNYVSPFGIFGKLADQIFLKRYMAALLTQRNEVIKAHAEEQKLKLTPDYREDSINFTFGEYTIGLRNDHEYNTESNDNLYRYSRIYDDPEKRYRPNTQYGIKTIADGVVVADCLISGCAGATGLHRHSALLEDDKLLVCCSDSLLCLKIPDLDLLWRVKGDYITCFEIRKLENDYIIHGEMSVSRIDPHGNIVWEFIGADVFVSDGHFSPFEIEKDRILLCDWSGRKYVLDFGGKEITE